MQYILDQANRVLDPQLKAEDIIGVFAGLRPLVANKTGSATTKLSREHTVDRPAPGFVSIAGGKYTTYRVMAKDAVDLAVLDLRRLVNDSVTEKLPLIGADGYFALKQQVAKIAEVNASSMNFRISRQRSSMLSPMKVRSPLKMFSFVARASHLKPSMVAQMQLKRWQRLLVMHLDGAQKNVTLQSATSLL